MQHYLWRTFSALLMMALFSCGGLDHNPIPETEKPTPPTQPETVVITLQPQQTSLPDEGGEVFVSVVIKGGDGIWNALKSASATWIELEIVNPSASAGQLKITAQPNKVALPRETEITIASNKQTVQIVVFQNAAGSLLITKNSYEVPQTGATIDVEVKHDVEFQTEIPEAFTTWILPVTTKQLAVTTRSFLVKPNADKAARDGYVNIVSKLGSERVTIRQAAAPESEPDPKPNPEPEQPDKIEVETSIVTFKNIGGQQKIALTASSTFAVNVMQGGDWLRVVSTSQTELLLEASENKTQQKRDAVVKLNCGEAYATVNITQDAAPAPIYETSITISAPGTLEIAPELLETLTTLKVEGPLNGHDFQQIRLIKNLNNLDLTGVTGTSLPAEAYELAAKLKSLTLPATLEKIPIGAFSGIRNLQKIVIGASVQTIENNAFSGCSALEVVEFAVVSQLREVGDGVFFGCRKLGQVNFPQGVERLGSTVFSGCSALKNVGLPAGLREVGLSAFVSCVALESVVIPEGVLEIGISTFSNCLALRSVRLPASLLRLGSGAMGGCKKLVEVVCGAVEPPELEGGRGVFLNIGSGCGLRVPTGSGEKYKAAEGWKEVFAGRVVEGM